MAFTKKTVRDIDVRGKKVLMRVDFNVPLKDGVVTDDTRVRAAIPTIQYLKEQGAGVILMSHLGRPKGDGPEPELSLKPAADKLAELTGYEVTFVDDTYGDKAAAACAAVKPGDIIVLENVRFRRQRRKTIPRC
jgi:phosphoglycerate kinase